MSSGPIPDSPEPATPAPLLRRLTQAVDDVDLGLSRGLSLGLRASRALEQIGEGGRVDVNNAATVYRAIRLLEAAAV
jgi:hypothetical protein